MARGFKSGGRQKNTPNKVTSSKVALANRAIAEGKTPLEVMIENMRHFQQVALDAEAVIAGLSFEGEPQEPDAQFKKLLAEVKKAAGFRQMAHDCACDAAPYIHPRLAAIEHTGKDGKDLIPEYTDDQRAKALAVLMAKTHSK